MTIPLVDIVLPLGVGKSFKLAIIYIELVPLAMHTTKLSMVNKAPKGIFQYKVCIDTMLYSRDMRLLKMIHNNWYFPLQEWCKMVSFQVKHNQILSAKALSYKMYLQRSVVCLCRSTYQTLEPSHLNTHGHLIGPKTSHNKDGLITIGSYQYTR